MWRAISVLGDNDITMKKIHVAFIVIGLFFASGFLPARAQNMGMMTVEGKVTQAGTPLPNVQIVLTDLGTGRTFKTKSSKNGQFTLAGVTFGNFRVDVLGEKGEKLHSQQASIEGDPASTNFINIDVPKGGDAPAPTADANAPKLTKEQLAKIKSDNEKISKLNSLIQDAQTARQTQNWAKAEDSLKKLISAAPDSSRWEFYSALGEAQSHSNELPDAAQTYEKGIQVAHSLATGATPPDPKNPNSTPAAAKSGEIRMLTSQGNVYLKLEKPDDAIASLKKAADLEPSSAIGQYNLCGVEYTAQKFDDAKTSCNKYLQLEPAGPHADEVKGFLSQMGSQ
jgi:Flp pilus assembly protein TadD